MEGKTVFHFMARCLILAIIRLQCLLELDEEAFDNYSNGRDCQAVGNYMNLSLDGTEVFSARI